MWASTDLAALPDGFKVPDELTAQLTPLFEHNATAQKLLWRGPMSTAQRDQMLTLSADSAYSSAIEALFANAAERTLVVELPPTADGIVHYDGQRRALIATGAVPDSLAGELRRLSPEPAYQRAVAKLISASGAGRAVAQFRDLVDLSLWAGNAFRTFLSALLS